MHSQAEPGNEAVQGNHFHPSCYSHNGQFVKCVSPTDYLIVEIRVGRAEATIPRFWWVRPRKIPYK